MTYPTDHALALLRDVGPMTRAELQCLTGRGETAVRNSIRTLRARHAVRVSAYERQPDGRGGRGIPIYSVGDSRETPDASEPCKSARQRTRDYQKRHRARLRTRETVRLQRTPNFWAGLL